MYSIRYISCRKCFALCILTIILSIYSFSWTMRLIIYDDTLYYSVTFILIVLYSRCFKIARIIYVVCGMVHNLNILNLIVYKTLFNKNCVCVNMFDEICIKLVYILFFATKRTLSMSLSIMSSICII